MTIEFHIIIVIIIIMTGNLFFFFNPNEKGDAENTFLMRILHWKAFRFISCKHLIIVVDFSYIRNVGININCKTILIK